MICALNDVISFFQANWPAFAVGTMLFITLVIVIVCFAIASNRDDMYKATVKSKSNSVRVFVIDTAAQKVTYFNVTDLRKIKTVPMSQFYTHFAPQDQDRVMDWLKEIMDPKAHPAPYLEANIVVKHSKEQYFSMLELDHVDQKKSKIFLLSHLLNFVSGDKNVSRGLSTMNEVSSAIKLAPKNKGVTMCFRFRYRKVTDHDKEIDQLIFNQLKNVFFPYLSKKAFLMEASRNELIYTDTRIYERSQVIALCRSLLNAISRYLSLNSYSSLLDIKVGIVEHKHFPLQGETIVKSAQETASLAFESMENEDPISWYHVGMKSNAIGNDSSYRTEVERIISDKKLSYSFRPIYAVEKGRVLGYFAHTKPVDTYFDSIDELKDYAVRTEDDRSLFNTIAKNVVPVFVSEKLNPTESLFFPVRMNERPYMLVSFARLGKAKESHIVFMFTESDIHAQIDLEYAEGLIEDMRAIKAKGYEVALLLDQHDLSLPSVLYPSFDYYVVTFASSGSATGINTKIRANLHSLVEKLLKYNKPIIATDIDGWNAIELLVRSGLNYISSDAFAPYDQMILPVPPKSLKKIKDLKGK